MPYADDVPTVFNQQPVASALLNGPRILFIGDSRVAGNATDCPLHVGAARMWPIQFDGIVVPAANLGSSFWLHGGFSSTLNAAARTLRRPDQTFSGGETDLCPTLALDYPLTANLTDGSNSVMNQALLTQLGQLAGGDRLGATQASVRIPWYRGAANSTPSVRLVSYRNTGTDSSFTYSQINSVTQTLTGTAGWQYTDISCGTGAGAPGFGVVENSVNETNTRWYQGPVLAYRGNAGTTPTAGVLGTLGVGGYCSTDVWRQLGGDGANAYCTVANAVWFFANIYLWPNVIILPGIGQNAINASTGADPLEVSQLNAGIATNFESNHNSIIDQINVIYDTGGQPRPRIVLANDVVTQYSALHSETRGRALYRIAQQRGLTFVDLYRLVNNSRLYQPDNIHFTGPAVFNYTATGQGADAVALVLWNSLIYPPKTPSVRGRFR